MRPLKISAIMQDGRIATTEPWLPLDSILSAAWIRKYHPEQFYLPATTSNNIIIADLPLAKTGNAEDWAWSCSFNTIRPITEYIMHWHKRFDDYREQYIDFRGKRGKIDAKAGKYKSYRMPLVVQIYDRLEWYAIGDIDKVKELCSMITHIGKKTSQGLGAVDHWEVIPWHEDWSLYCDNRLTRAIPITQELRSGVEAITRQYGIRPPYWLSDNQRICYLPRLADG